MEGTIQRFEVVVELIWKTLKRALEFEGLTPKTPRETLLQAFASGWLRDEDSWLDMLDRRNTTSHRYLDEELVANNYRDIHRIFPEIRLVTRFLRERYPIQA
jgi:nucleotidyltransferase substrate binding protein (TIGR01987 family)